MHPLHSLAHRAPPATRTTVRWQPYNSMPPSTRSSSPRDLRTPLSVLTIPLVRFPPQSDLSHRLPLTTPKIAKELSPRDPNKTKFTLGLVDQTVKAICEIWRPQDIPSVFNSPSHTAITVKAAVAPRPRNINNQLPTPPSPSTLPPSPLSAVLSETFTEKGMSTPTNPLVPIRSFVHEVLRRSRTSGGVLQTALCYLEAIRPKIPQLVKQEQHGQHFDESAQESRICRATDVELAECIAPASVMDTVRICDDNSMPMMDPPDPIVACSQSVPSCLPSPLLCPRRAFLACLILASKFTQDKCYSNRAWAKLSGLPAREISRCERALGEALDWRLWVGKRPSAPSPPCGLVPLSNQPVVRSQSMSSLTDPIPSRLPFLAPVIKPENSSGLGNLRRCATLPNDAYTCPPSTSFGNMPWRISPEANHDDTESISLDTNKPMTISATTTTQNHSPILDTPGLTYSPSSSESSSGDQTIQISNFFNDGLAGSNASVTPWLLETPPFAPAFLPKTPSPPGHTLPYPIVPSLGGCFGSIAKAYPDGLPHACPWIMNNEVPMSQLHPICS